MKTLRILWPFGVAVTYVGLVYGVSYGIAWIWGTRAADWSYWVGFCLPFGLLLVPLLRRAQ